MTWAWLEALRERAAVEPIREHFPYSRRWSRNPEKGESDIDRRETALLRDVAFNRHSMNDGVHVSPLANSLTQIGADGIGVRLVQGLDEVSFKRTLAMATRATIGLDLDVALPGDWEQCPQALQAFYAHEPYDTERELNSGSWLGKRFVCVPQHSAHRFSRDTSRNWRAEGQVSGDADWEEMLKGGLQTALESQVVVFAVSGVSRTCTHQLVRSRRAAFHQQSQRAGFYGDEPEVRMPESIWLNDRARVAFVHAIDAAREAYSIACEEDISYQDARYALPEATTNYILCEYNVKEFRDVYAYRGCSMFSWEIVHVMREMRRLLVEAHPFLAPHIRISCEKTHGALDVPEIRADGALAKATAHSCTFQGWESVEGQCDFAWARQSNRTFLPDPKFRIGG
jgi:thymidylate synthase (FAD)